MAAGAAGRNDESALVFQELEVLQADHEAPAGAGHGREGLELAKLQQGRVRGEGLGLLDLGPERDALMSGF